MLCILIAGVPASGKSYMARRLSELLGLPMFSKDDMKELLFDTVGFRSRQEKVALGVGAMEILYYAAGQVLSRDGSVILENNFETVSVPGLHRLLDRFSCQPATVQLTGEPEALYERFVRRDTSPERHRGHVVNTCYPEPPGERPVYVPITQEQFVEGFTKRGMADFHIGGPRLVVDVTELDKVDYEAVAQWLRKLL